MPPSVALAGPQPSGNTQSLSFGYLVECLRRLVRGQLRDRLARQVWRVWRRWLQPTSGRRSGDRFL